MQAYAQAWDKYWQGVAEAGYQGIEADHQVIEAFWHQWFCQQLSQRQNCVLLELASGKGAVSKLARQHIDGQNAAAGVSHFCLDYSHSAVGEATRLIDGTSGIVADGARLPIQAQSVDLIFSQFGIEYAGLEAITASAELLKPGGELALIIHAQDSAICLESKTNAQALSDTIASDIFARAIAVFEAGYAQLAGKGSAEAFSQADAAFAPAVKRVTQILQQHGPQIAGGILMRFYRQLGEMFQRLERFDQKQVMAWLQSMEQELKAYQLRMASMVEAAVSEDELKSLAQQLTARGLNPLTYEAIGQDELKLGWKLQAIKSQ